MKFGLDWVLLFIGCEIVFDNVIIIVVDKWDLKFLCKLDVVVGCVFVDLMEDEKVRND